MEWYKGSKGSKMQENEDATNQSIKKKKKSDEMVTMGVSDGGGDGEYGCLGSVNVVKKEEEQDRENKD